MRWGFFLCVFMMDVFLLARPREISVWFISPSEVKEGPLAKSLLYYQKQRIRKSAYFVNSSVYQYHLDCRPMGDLFFHSTLGLHSHDFHRDTPIEFSPPVRFVPEEDAGDHQDGGFLIDEVPTLERDEIKCKRGEFFDFFCGKSTDSTGYRGKRDAEVEVWIDTSSSMREVDWDPKGQCYRYLFVKKLIDKYRGGITLKTFDVVIKGASFTTGDLCQTYGLNDEQELINTIEKSEVQQLFIVTDIFEFKPELKNYLDKIAAKVYGDAPTNPIHAQELPLQAK